MYQLAEMLAQMDDTDKLITLMMRNHVSVCTIEG